MGDLTRRIDAATPPPAPTTQPVRHPVKSSFRLLGWLAVLVRHDALVPREVTPLLPPWVRAFRERWPRVELELIEATGDVQRELIARGDVDAGFTATRPPSEPVESTEPPTTQPDTIPDDLQSYLDEQERQVLAGVAEDPLLQGQGVLVELRAQLGAGAPGQPGP